METTGKKLYVGYQLHSLIEFLLGDGIRPGWLDHQPHSRLLSRTVGAGDKTNPI
jgi:hypothetical protein